MPDFCDFSGCTNIASQRCARCKISHYCCKEHQRAAWKEHKKMCNELVSTQEEEKILPAKREDSSFAGMEPVIKMMEGMMPRGGSTIPDYHEEYKREYPTDKVGYNKLKPECMRMKFESTFKLSPHAREFPILDKFGKVHQLLLKRWQCFNLELIDALCRLKPGEIWTEHPHLSNPVNITRDFGRYQTMRNTASVKLQLERGKNYVSVGFVDLQQVMEADILDSDTDAPVHWYGYESSEIAVARAMIILDLINHEAPVNDILQIWYSSCISGEAGEALRDSCQRLSKIESDQKLVALFNYWKKMNVGVKESHARWSQYFSASQIDNILNLRKAKDRVFYARYVLTGEFMLDSSLTNEGNVTFFCLPNSYKDHKKVDENMFFSFDVMELEYATDLKRSVERRFHDLLAKMSQNIKQKRLHITVTTRCIDPQQRDINRQIKELNPVIIEWSNLPDFFTFSDFFSMAKQCSGSRTMHTFHLMNWVTKVFGTNLVDYVDVNENYLNPHFSPLGEFNDRSGKIGQMMEKLREGFISLVKGHNIPSFLIVDVSILCEMKISEEVLYHRYLDSFMKYMFQGRDLAEMRWQRRYTMISRTSTTIDASFSFKR